MFNVPELTHKAFALSTELGTPMSFKKCKRIVWMAVKKIEADEDRRFGLCFKTTDNYKSITYSDTTGEEAVMNLIRSLLVSA